MFETSRKKETMETSNATQATERVFMCSYANTWGPQNFPVTYAQIEAKELANTSPEERATAFALNNDDGRWVVFIDYSEYVDGDEEAELVGVFGGSEEDAREVARLVRESANGAKTSYQTCPFTK